jgi:DNA-binding MarR family transcriptional regulator
MNKSTRVINQDEMLRRIRGEYLEMPGLRLLPEQARRLWGLDPQTCSHLLQALVDRGFLCRRADGTYGRRTDDPSRQAS